MELGFWWTMLAFCALIPLLMLGFGRLLYKKPPQDANFLFGYRTARSMKNADTWAFAQRTVGRLWWRAGLVLLPLTVVGMLICLFTLARDEDTVGFYSIAFLYTQMAILILSILPVERALRRAFDEDGNRRENTEK